MAFKYTILENEDVNIFQFWSDMLKPEDCKSFEGMFPGNIFNIFVRSLLLGFEDTFLCCAATSSR